MRVHFASANRIGKATAQAKDLAKRASEFTSVEIYVYPAPEMKELEKLRERVRQLENPINYI